MSIIDLITPQHLNEDMQLIADACSIDVVRTLMSKVPGARIYIPFPQHLAPLVEEYIVIRVRDGASASTIARELGRPVEYIRKCIRTGRAH